MFNAIRDFFADKEVRPNKFTRYMGDRVKQAREEAGMSQEKLAELVYLRRATLSDIENGKTEPDASTYVHIAYSLNKPLAYFLPNYVYKEIKQEDLSPAENELITNFRYHVASDQFKKLVIDVIKAIGEFDIDSFVIEQTPYVQAKQEHEEEVKKARSDRKKK